MTTVLRRIDVGVTDANAGTEKRAPEKRIARFGFDTIRYDLSDFQTAYAVFKLTRVHHKNVCVTYGLCDSYVYYDNVQRDNTKY